jgi:hypothetical protein
MSSDKLGHYLAPLAFYGRAARHGKHKISYRNFGSIRVPILF